MLGYTGDNMDVKKDFFVSYNKVDKQWAKWIAATLEAEGYSCIIQAWDFRPGDNFVLDMHNALINSERFIAVLSPDYLTSLYCQAEWSAAFIKDPNSEKRIFIPVRVKDFEPEGLLAGVIYIDLYGTDETTAGKRLINGVDTKDIPRNRPSFPGTRTVRFPNSLPFNNLPYIRNVFFTGRSNVLDDLSKEFDTGSAVSLTQTITGLGGIGKTQTALEYAYRYAEKYDWIWWIIAESEATVMKAYQEFALKIKLINDTQQDNKIIREAVLTWMDTHEKWLFIFDNLDSVSGDTAWWPRNNRGNILITTRNQRLSIGKGIDVSVFTEEEAKSFLEKRTGIYNDPQNAALLSKRLGYLPLALEQAAAFIKDSLNFPEYLMLLDKHGLTVLEETDGVIDYSMPVTATWEISFEKINIEGAKQLLYLCAYMASDNIDSSMFSENAKLLPPPLCAQLANDLHAIKVWKELTRFSLLHKQDDKQSYSMHRLLQEVVRKKIDIDSQWAHCCLMIFINTFDFQYGELPSHHQFIRQLPHVEALLTHIELSLKTEIDRIKLAKLYGIGGIGLFYLADYIQSMYWFENAKTICEKELGTDHQDTAFIYSNIALIHKTLGNYSKALQWYHKALIIDEKVLGDSHPQTISLRNNIARVFEGLGDYDKALEWYLKALSTYNNIDKDVSLNDATIYNNIGNIYFHKGNPSKALVLYQMALEICNNKLGVEHPYIASTYNNIAMVLESQGNYSGALEWLMKDLGICERVFGPTHPSTAITYSNIAGVYESMGNYSKSLELYNKARPIYESVYGIEHPETASLYNNIADVYESMGNYTKALELYNNARIIDERLLGMKHPETATIYSNIAFTFTSQGDASTALQWYERAYEIYRNSLGVNHLKTKITFESIRKIRDKLK